MAYDKAVDSGELETGLTTISDAIRAKGGTSDPLEFPQEMAQAIADIPTGGGNEWAYDLNKLDFGGNSFPAGTNLNIRTRKCGAYNSAFAGTVGPGLTVKISTDEMVKNFNIGLIFSNSDITVFDFTGIKVEKWSNQTLNQTFQFCSHLEKIIGEIDASTASDYNAFRNCRSLVELRFKVGTISNNLSSIKDSAKLSPESIQSIIDGLADLSGQSPQTLTLHPNVKARLTAEQRTAITNKNWTLA